MTPIATARLIKRIMMKPNKIFLPLVRGFLGLRVLRGSEAGADFGPELVVLEDVADVDRS